MTRVSVNHTLSRLYWLLTIVLLLLLAAKFADDIPGVPPGRRFCGQPALRIHARHVAAHCNRRRGLPVEHLPEAVEGKSQGVEHSAWRLIAERSGPTRPAVLIGLYRFEPLHDMPAQTLDPRLSTEVTTDRKNLARDAICRPSTLARNTRSMWRALVMQDHQRRRLERQPQIRPDIDMMPAGLRDNEVVNAGTSPTAPDQKLQGT